MAYLNSIIRRAGHEACMALMVQCERMKEAGNEIRKDVIVLGAGASGMFTAIAAGRRGRSVLVLDHGQQAGRKLSITGGGSNNCRAQRPTAL